MKKNLLFVVMLTLSVLGRAFGQEFWERIYTLPDSCNRTYDIATNAQGDIFVATDKGLYKSSDYTETWESVWWERNSPCTALDISPNGTICLGRYSPDLLFSNDNGVSWESVEMYNPGSFEMYYRVKYFGNDTLFALPRCLGHGAYVDYSFDGGNTWNYKSIGNWNLDYTTDITMAQDRVFYVCLAYFGNKSDDNRPAKGGVFKSSDCVEWENVEIGNSVESFFVIASSEASKAIILGDMSNMSKSPVDDNIMLMRIRGCTFLDDNKVIACGSKTYISNDGGQSFVSVNDANGGSRIIAGKDGYLYSVFYGYTLPGTRLTQSINPINDLLHLNDYSNNMQISVFPNPATDEIIITYEGNCFNLRVYSSDGTLVSNKVGQDIVALDVADYKKGAYLFQIIVDNKITTHKIIIK